MAKLKKLKSLVLNHNKLKEFPRELCNFKQLEQLILGFNEIKEMPKEISKLSNLKTLILNGNPLTESEYLKIKQLLPQTTVIFNVKLSDFNED
jgi:Leucine-rich repeat (LRR) protein